MYRAALLGAVIVATIVLRFITQPVLADDKILTKEEAEKLGLIVELVTPKPSVVYAKLRFPEEPQGAQLVLRDDKDKWVANTSMKVSDKSCTAWLAEEYVSRSYFIVTTNADGHSYHVPLR